MKRKFLMFLLIFSTIALSTLLASCTYFAVTGVTPTPTPPKVTPTHFPYSKTHILGGFEINTPAKARQAATDGIQVVFRYGDPPSERDSLGQQLLSLHMQVVDGAIWRYLYYYECYRTLTIVPPPAGQQPYCTTNAYPSITSEAALLAAISAHLRQEQHNSLIVGYWVLDDWVAWDAGSARPLLVKIHQLIQQYTPGRPAICGFGGSITPYSDSGAGWDDWVGANFTPQGCDQVGLYVYSASQPEGTTPPSSDVFDWSMRAILKAMYASLEQRGWDIAKEPVIGIGQAFGGPIASTGRYWITPSAQNIETQSRGFCKNGASGLSFYAWDNGGFGLTSQTPMNSDQIAQGIARGITACKQVWNTNS